MTHQGIEIGVDTGGTFTDVVCRLTDGSVHMIKVPSTREDPSVAVLKALDILADTAGIDRRQVTTFVHGTTVATNQVLEGKGAKVGLITTKGFRDVFEIGRQLRRQLYAAQLKATTPIFLAPRRMRLEVPERITSDGRIMTPLDEAALIEAVDELVGKGAQSIAVCFLFSFLNPVHEQRACEIIRERHPHLAVSASHEVDPTMREYERSVVSAFDAYVKPGVNVYLGHLENGLKRAKVPAHLKVMQSRGGLAGAGVARQRPVRLFLSGPAAGVIGGQLVGESAGIRDLITIDVGGTSADIALISRGEPMIRQEAQIAGYDVRVSMVDVNTLGSGGGSIARIDAGGGLKVGPQSAGAEPGPASYGRGGTDATVTDASLVLGYLDPGYFAGGTMQLDITLAEKAVTENIAKPLGLSTVDAALGIHRVLNSQMAEGIRLVSIRQGLDPRDFTLVPLGGGGGVHATALASELGMRRVLVPAAPGTLSAAGLLAAPTEHEITAAMPMPLAQYEPAKVAQQLAAIDERATALMAEDGVDPASVTISYFADICYVGQAYTLEVALDPARSTAQSLYDAFFAEHELRFGYGFKTPAKLVNLRAVHRAGGSTDLPAPPVPAGGEPVRGHRIIHTTDMPKGCEAAIFTRSAMAPGYRFNGPAIIEQQDTTTLVEPGWRGHVDAAGNIILDRD